MQTDSNGFRFYSTLDEAKQDGYSPVKITSVLSFFRLKGRKTIICKDNIEPIPDLLYCIKTDKLYVKDFRGHSLDELFFYRDTINFSGQSETIEALQRYVYDNVVYILFDKTHVESISGMLQRLYKHKWGTGGKLDYRVYIRLLHEYLTYEDYREYGKSLTGFLTVCSLFEKRIDELWKIGHKESS